MQKKYAPTKFGAYLLHTVSFLELIYTAACVNKLLLTCKVGMTLIADFHLDGICVLCCSCLKGSATSTYNSRFVIIRMYTLFHIAFTSLVLQAVLPVAKSFYYNNAVVSRVFTAFDVFEHLLAVFFLKLPTKRGFYAKIPSR